MHLRQKDFIVGRPKDVPNLEHAVKQIKEILHIQGLSIVFIATDAPIKGILECYQLKY